MPKYVVETSYRNVHSSRFLKNDTSMSRVRSGILLVEVGTPQGEPPAAEFNDVNLADKVCDFLNGVT